jgi:sterol desaturase/sphingolipid hydroxylase (fatty acid hydroxylase superfamily)
MTKYLLPIFIVCISIELIWKYRTKRTVSPRDYTHNGILFVLNNIVGFLTKTLVLGSYFWVYQYRLFDLGNAWWVWVLAFVADDLSYYLLHLASHKFRFFWASHVVHHSSTEFNLSTNLRQSFTGNLTGTFLFWAWIPMLGVDHNKNLGGVLIIWDRLFGTFREETERHPYGIDHPHANANIFAIVFHEWIDLLNEFRQSVWKKGVAILSNKSNG